MYCLEPGSLHVLSVTDFRDKYVPGLHSLGQLWVIVDQCVARNGTEAAVCGWHWGVSTIWGHPWLKSEDTVLCVGLCKLCL